MKKFLFLFLLFFSCQTLFAQEPYPWKRDTVIAGSKYRIYNNWLTAGAGWCHNFSYGRDQFNINLDFNFHITDKYFQLGTFFSGNAFRNYSNYNFHLCYGKRIEGIVANISYFAGPSFSTGYKKTTTQTQSDPYNEPGIFGQFEYVRKIKYDVGVGAGLFVDATLLQTITGFKFIIYFSGAYKGKK